MNANEDAPRYQVIECHGEPVLVGPLAGAFYRRENAEAEAAWLNESGVPEGRPYSVRDLRP